MQPCVWAFSLASVATFMQCSSSLHGADGWPDESFDVPATIPISRALVPWATP